MKDTPIDRVGPRQRLTDSLDTIFKEPIDPKLNLDSVEGKLFGIGCESYTVGSHEFYFGYALSRKILLCARQPATITRPKPSPTRSERGVRVPAGDPAARQPRRPLGQRPRRHS